MKNKTEYAMEKLPFIKLIEMYGEYYFFDVNTNDIVRISENLYHYLDRLLKNPEIEPQEEGVASEINTLKMQGYLSEHRVKVLRHPASDSLESYLERKLSSVTLQVTQGCNLRCSYCIYSDVHDVKQRSHSGKRMTMETALKAVDFLAEHSIDNDQVNVGFYGGEPLLEFELIRSVIRYAEKLFSDKRVTFSLTTNGTLITEEIIDYLAEHDVRLLVSMDGPKEIHDINRRFAANGEGSFDRIIENLRKIKEKYPDYFDKTGLSVVIDPQNDFDAINGFFSLTDLDMYNNIHTAIVDDIYSMEKTVYSEEYAIKNIYHVFLAYLAMKSRTKKNLLSPIAMNEFNRLMTKQEKSTGRSRLPEKWSHSGPCIPGQNRLLVDVEGNFYPCERVSESSEAMKIGNLQEGFEYDKARKLLNIVELTGEECRKCWAINHCTICAKHADDGDRLSGEKVLSFCRNIRERALEDIKNFILFRRFGIARGESEIRG